MGGVGMKAKAEKMVKQKKQKSGIVRMAFEMRDEPFRNATFSILSFVLFHILVLVFL